MRIEDLRQHPAAVERLADWHFDEWQHLYPDQRREDFAEDLRRCLGQDAVPATWVLVNGEGNNAEVWGSASVVEQDMDTNRDLGPWLANVYVHPRYRGQGLGSRLIRQVMDQCRALEVNDLYLFTPDQQHLYASLGWQPLRTEHYHGEAVTIMKARLPRL